jgi:1-deoxy-D-xylulose-5-phosphate synthase
MPELLSTINDPSDLRRLDRTQLQQLAVELRAFVVESVARTGGHLSSNLGTVELTVALHYVFNTPHDRLVWDVGHQTYPHKILTGRREGMNRLRSVGGIVGLSAPHRERVRHLRHRALETSISGCARHGGGGAQQGSDRHAIAVIGDGAMSAGMAFEALNNAGVTDGTSDLLVILNDNDMSISPAVGALNVTCAADERQALFGRAQAGKKCSRTCRRCDLAEGSRNTPRAWWCRPRCSRNSASTTSARSTATTSMH